jgi:hypothetical protein
VNELSTPKFVVAEEGIKILVASGPLDCKSDPGAFLQLKVNLLHKI